MGDGWENEMVRVRVLRGSELLQTRCLMNVLRDIFLQVCFPLFCRMKYNGGDASLRFHCSISGFSFYLSGWQIGKSQFESWRQKCSLASRVSSPSSCFFSPPVPGLV